MRNNDHATQKIYDPQSFSINLHARAKVDRTQLAETLKLDLLEEPGPTSIISFTCQLSGKERFFVAIRTEDETGESDFEYVVLEHSRERCREMLNEVSELFQNHLERN